MLIPRKRFGQHFLKDRAVIQRIITAIHPAPQDHLIEIGPGRGALTIPLLKLVKHLEAIEIDRDLIPILQADSRDVGDLKIYAQDVLEFDFNQLKTDQRPLRIIGNLPYNISTPLIFHLLDYTDSIADMVFMLQKEVAQRLAAAPDSEDYSRLSVMMQYHCQVNILFDVPAYAFQPPPRVTSSIVKLIPYPSLPHPANNYANFKLIVREAFGQRRKTLRNSLKKIIDPNLWTQIPIASDRRPETLSVKDFVTISNSLGS